MHAQHGQLMDSNIKCIKKLHQIQVIFYQNEIQQKETVTGYDNNSGTLFSLNALNAFWIFQLTFQRTSNN